jgi:hypothetical protein
MAAEWHGKLAPIHARGRIMPRDLSSAGCPNARLVDPSVAGVPYERERTDKGSKSI